MTKTDQKIIEKNPKATPHELLTVHGVSEQGFNELCASLDADAQQAQISTRPVLRPANIIKPQLPVLSSMGSTPRNGNKVRIIPPGGGKGTMINRIEAEKLVRRNPNYKISNNG